jgi:hypothetical protein
MFSLQPPRHISTLPDSDLRRCSLSRRYGDIADIKRAAGGLCMISYWIGGGTNGGGSDSQ